MLRISVSNRPISLEGLHLWSSAIYASAGMLGVYLKEVISMKPYRAAFRGEVLAGCDAHEATRAIAVRFKVSDSWVRRIQQQRRETGQTVAKQAAPRQPKWHAWSDWLLAKLAARPDIYLRELQAELKQERGIKVCLTTICNACRALQQSRKKRR